MTSIRYDPNNPEHNPALKRRPNVIPRVGQMGDSPALPGAVPLPQTPSMSGGNQTTNPRAQVGNETGHGVPPTGGLPGGGRTPGQVSGITPQLPPRPGTGPRPAARPLQRGSAAPPPPAPTPPAPIVEPQNPTVGIGVGSQPPRIPAVGNQFGPGNDLRFQQINPQASARTTAAGQAADQAATQVAGFNPAQRATELSGQIGQQLMPQNVGFQGMPTSVTRRAVDPNVQFRGVETDITPTQVGMADSADMNEFRGMRSNAARTLTEGPTRSEIARRELDAFDMESQPEIRDRMRAVAQRAGALGRTGMGETELEASQPFIDYLTRRAALESRLAGQTAEGEIADRQNVLNATRGLVGEEEQIGAGRRGEQRQDRSFETAVQESNIGRRMQERDNELGLRERNLGRDMDLMDRDVALDERNLSRGISERDAALGLEERNVGRQYDARRAALEAGMGLAGQEGNYGLSRYGAMAGREADLYGRDRGERDEMRGERDFQVGTAERATDRAVQNYGLEEDALQRNFDRQMRLEALRMGADPTGTMLGISDRMGQRGEGAMEGAGDLLGQWLAGRQGNRVNIPSAEVLERVKRGIRIPDIEVAY